MTIRTTSTVAMAFAAIAFAGLGGTARAEVPAQSKIINEELEKAWKANDIKPSKRANDFEFVRRAYIDIIGRIPTAEECRDFAEADSGADKRARLVERLLNAKDYRPKISERVNPKDSKSIVTYDYATEYARHFSNIWGVWLMTRGGVAEMYHESMEIWLEEQFYKNAPWDQMVKQLITATGKTNENGAAAFVMAHLGETVPAAKQSEDGRFDAIPITSRVTRLFLGVQTNCIQCHDHPFNPEWKQDNFWNTNIFFRQVERDGTPALREGNGGKKKMVATPVGLRDNPELNKDGRLFFERRSGIVTAAKPNFLPNLADFEKEGTIPRRGIPSSSASKSRREVLADYMIKHDNFAKAFVNRMFGHFFGRGMNEMAVTDDFGGHNKVVHPDLLQKLGDEFISSGYDIKKLISWICNSDAYSLSYQANAIKGKGSNATDEAGPYLSRMGLKSMSPEVLFESLETALRLDASPDKDAKKEKRERWMAKLTNNFGDDEGNEVTFNGTIIQALLMMNGPELNSEVSRKDGTSAVDKAMNRHKAGGGWNEMGVITDLYMMALSRRPSSTITVTVPRTDPKTGKVLSTTTSNEVAFLTEQVGALKRRSRGAADHKAFFEDILWSLLNTSEFILNH